MPTSPHDTRATLERIVAAAARFLPPQGPIDTFVAQNTLAGFEDLPFEEAVIRAARLYGAQPFLAEAEYRDALDRGRILVADIDAVLARDLGDRADRPLAGGRTNLRAVRRILMLHALRRESDAAVRWTLTESDCVERLRADLPPEIRHRLIASAADAPDAMGPASRPAAEQIAASDLWHACVEVVAGTRPALAHVPPPLRHRDLILAVDPTLDTDALVHPLLIRMVAAYLDQGVAAWPMPDRQLGLLAAVSRVYSGSLPPWESWSRHVPDRLRRIAAAQASAPTSACDVIAAELQLLGVPQAAWHDFIVQSLVALRGWAAMIRHLEERPDRAPVEPLPCRLIDFLALRLVLDRAATEWAARRLGHAQAPGSEAVAGLAAFRAELQDRHPPRRGPGSLSRALLLHQMSQLLGFAAADLLDLGENEVLELEQAITAFDSIDRRRLFHLAYERRHRIEVLDALAHLPRDPAPTRLRPRVQAVLCIDDRCESFRRYLEQSASDVETFGTAGFFAVPMYFHGIDDWHATPLCPIVVRPTHTVVEIPEAGATANHRFNQALRRSFGRVRGGMATGSRTLLGGGLVTSVGGAIAAVPLVTRVAFPRLTALLASRAADFTRRRVRTRLALTRDGDARLSDGTRPGFDTDEMAEIVRRLLEDIGLTDGFARLVVILGHGSTSLNNPHESAYDCGACGGGRGGPNARAFALMANDPAVRDRLAAAGLVIPADTVFVGGMLDTCTSRITWYDTDRVPASHRAELERFRGECHDAGGLDAQERCRRFYSVPTDVSPAEAVRRVQARAADLAQVRPEYGHASNAVCIVGRRHLTRGLFLDRRSFLVSYDPATDHDGDILTRTLAAVGPVCGGINLAYLFSRIDPTVYGAGTKLPHNITGLLGVMDGHASDLRTGLPLQGVEIHEPVRLLLVIDAHPDRVMSALDRIPAVKNMVEKRWIQLAAWDPATGRLAVHDDIGPTGAFVPYAAESRVLPTAPVSADWYRGRRDNVPPALLVGSARGGQEASR